MQEGPLAGLRVVDLTDDSGRFATKLLAECGASVVRVGRGSPGPAMRAARRRRPRRAARLVVRRRQGVASVDLESDAGAGRLPQAGRVGRPHHRHRRARPARRARRSTTPTSSAANPRLVQVSLTPFGRTGPRAGWQTSDLVAAALGGSSVGVRPPRRAHRRVGPPGVQLRRVPRRHLRPGWRAGGAGDGRRPARRPVAARGRVLVARAAVLPVLVRRSASRTRRSRPRQGSLHWSAPTWSSPLAPAG